MKELITCEDRLRSMIVLDKQETPQKINRLLKSEILFLLKNYFDICAEDVLLDVSVDDRGKYIINFQAESRTIKVAHVFNN